MEHEIIDQLLREAEDLQKKLDAVNAMLSAYGVDSFCQENAFPSKTQIVRERCLYIVSAQNGSLIKTRDILKALKDEGYEIGGMNEVTTLSAMMSNSGLFRAVGRKGWVLK